MKYRFTLRRELVAAVEVEADSLSDAVGVVAAGIEAGEDRAWRFEDIGRYDVFEDGSGMRVLEVDDPDCVTWTF